MCGHALSVHGGERWLRGDRWGGELEEAGVPACADGTVPGDRGSRVLVPPGLCVLVPPGLGSLGSAAGRGVGRGAGRGVGRGAGRAHAPPRAFNLLYFHATMLQAGGSRPQHRASSSSPSRRRGQAAPPPPHLPLDTIFKTFNIKVKFIILDPEKHFVRLRSSRCKQSTTGTKPAPWHRRPPALGPDGRRGDGCPRRHGDGNGGPVVPFPWRRGRGGSAIQPCPTALLWEQIPRDGNCPAPGRQLLAGDVPGALRVHAPPAHSEPP